MQRAKVLIATLCLTGLADPVFADDRSELFRTICMAARGDADAAIAAAMQEGSVETASGMGPAAAGARTFNLPRGPLGAGNFVVIGQGGRGRTVPAICMISFGTGDVDEVVETWTARLGWAPEGDGHGDGDVLWMFTQDGEQPVRTDGSQALRTNMYVVGVGPAEPGVSLLMLTVRP